MDKNEQINLFEHDSISVSVSNKPLSETPAPDIEDEDDELNFLKIGRKIEFNRSERRIRDLKNDEIDGILEKQPFFQRNYVWTDKKASQLIESILLNVPLLQKIKKVEQS